MLPSVVSITESKVVVGLMNGIHSDISSRPNLIARFDREVVPSVSGDTRKDPWYLRIGKKED